MNRAIITGRVGQDPTIRTLKGQKGDFLAADFSVAVKMTHRKGDEVVWVKVQALGYSAEFAQKYVKKGTAVLVEGELQENRYTDKSGKEQKVWHIQAEEIKQLYSPSTGATYTPPMAEDVEPDSEDLPF
jgi:single-strand DNA-binding protein